MLGSSEKRECGAREAGLVWSPEASEGYVIQKEEDKCEMACMLGQMFGLYSENISFGISLWAY